MNRRQLRDYTFKMLFHVNFYSDQELTQQLDTYLDSCMLPEEGQLLLIEPEKQELQARMEKILAHLPEIDESISSVTEGWKLARMNKVDLSIIRLACYEVQYDDAVPDKVAVNEAVELAKRYGGDESPQFVNGVMAKFLKKEAGEAGTD